MFRGKSHLHRQIKWERKEYMGSSSKSGGAGQVTGPYGNNCAARSTDSGLPTSIRREML